MYYRVAMQGDPSPTWRWMSTVLTSLEAVLQWLWLYRALPHGRLRIFASSSREDMDEQLARENNGLGSTSVTAARFLQERGLCSSEMARAAPEHGTGGNQEVTSSTVSPTPSWNESSTRAYVPHGRSASWLESRRIELEDGAGGDHDLPYLFSLPTSMPQTLAWTKLLARVERGELQP